MNENEACSFTLDEVLEKYKSYNNDLTKIIASANSILSNNKVAEEDYRIFSEFREFQFLIIPKAYLKDLPIFFVAITVHNIFKENIEAFCLLNINSAESENYIKLLDIFVDSPFAQTDLFKGLCRLVAFYEGIQELSVFREDTITNTKISSSKFPTIKDSYLNVSKFKMRMEACENDRERLAMIRSEIRRIKINCIGDGYLFTADLVQEYIKELEEIETVLMQYSDDSIDGYWHSSAPDSFKYAKQPPVNKHCHEETAKNADHTAMRKSIVIYYLFNEISSSLFDFGNKKAIARFASFLTGNSHENIYKNFNKMFAEMDKATPARKKDFEFVINELDKINLGVISNKIKRDVEGGMER